MTDFTTLVNTLRGRQPLSPSKFVSLSCQPLSYENVQAVAEALRGKSPVSGLRLGGCNIDDQQARLLAYGLETNTVLETLELPDNQIGTEGAGALLQVLQTQNCALKMLDLTGNPCHSSAPEVLAEIAKLLQRNRVIRAMVANRPRTPIVPGAGGATMQTGATASRSSSFTVGGRSGSFTAGAGGGRNGGSVLHASNADEADAASKTLSPSAFALDNSELLSLGPSRFETEQRLQRLEDGLAVVTSEVEHTKRFSGSMESWAARINAASRQVEEVLNLHHSSTAALGARLSRLEEWQGATDAAGASVGTVIDAVTLQMVELGGRLLQLEQQHAEWRQEWQQLTAQRAPPTPTPRADVATQCCEFEADAQSQTRGSSNDAGSIGRDEQSVVAASDGAEDVLHNGGASRYEHDMLALQPGDWQSRDVDVGVSPQPSSSRPAAPCNATAAPTSAATAVPAAITAEAAAAVASPKQAAAVRALDDKERPGTEASYDGAADGRDGDGDVADEADCMLNELSGLSMGDDELLGGSSTAALSDPRPPGMPSPIRWHDNLSIFVDASRQDLPSDMVTLTRAQEAREAERLQQARQQQQQQQQGDARQTGSQQHIDRLEERVQQLEQLVSQLLPAAAAHQALDIPATDAQADVLLAVTDSAPGPSDDSSSAEATAAPHDVTNITSAALSATADKAAATFAAWASPARVDGEAAQRLGEGPAPATAAPPASMPAAGGGIKAPVACAGALPAGAPSSWPPLDGSSSPAAQAAGEQQVPPPDRHLGAAELPHAVMPSTAMSLINYGRRCEDMVLLAASCDVGISISAAAAAAVLPPVPHAAEQPSGMASPVRKDRDASPTQAPGAAAATGSATATSFGRNQQKGGSVPASSASVAIASSWPCASSPLPLPPPAKAASASLPDDLHSMLQPLCKYKPRPRRRSMDSVAAPSAGTRHAVTAAPDVSSEGDLVGVGSSGSSARIDRYAAPASGSPPLQDDRLTPPGRLLSAPHPSGGMTGRGTDASKRNGEVSRSFAAESIDRLVRGVPVCPPATRGASASPGQQPGSRGSRAVGRYAAVGSRLVRGQSVPADGSPKAGQAKRQPAAGARPHGRSPLAGSSPLITAAIAAGACGNPSTPAPASATTNNGDNSSTPRGGWRGQQGAKLSPFQKPPPMRRAASATAAAPATAAATAWAGSPAANQLTATCGDDVTRSHSSDTLKATRAGASPQLGGKGYGSPASNGADGSPAPAGVGQGLAGEADSATRGKRDVTKTPRLWKN